MADRATTPTAKLITDFEERFALQNRLWQGCPTVEHTAKGTLFAGWYSGGTREPSLENYNVLYRSKDKGFTLEEKPVLVIASDPEAKKVAIDIELWIDPAGKLWVFWVERECTVKRKQPGHLALFAITTEDPDAETIQWSPVQYIGDGFMRCRPTVLSDGRWLLPAYDWRCNSYSWSETADQGKTFYRRTGGKKVCPDNFDESMFFETAERNEVTLLARSATGFIAQSVSSDGGSSWSDGVNSSIVSASSRLFVRRLKNGRLLLIHNAHESGRTNLTAKLSDDNGLTWKWSLLLDDGDDISYPDAVELPDGSIIIIYDHGRPSFKEILTARITQEDIENGKLAGSAYSTSFLRHIISKAPAVTDKEAYEKRRLETESWVKALCDFWE